MPVRSLATGYFQNVYCPVGSEAPSRIGKSTDPLMTAGAFTIAFFLVSIIASGFFGGWQTSVLIIVSALALTVGMICWLMHAVDRRTASNIALMPGNLARVEIEGGFEALFPFCSTVPEGAYGKIRFEAWEYKWKGVDDQWVKEREAAYSLSLGQIEFDATVNQSDLETAWNDFTDQITEENDSRISAANQAKVLSANLAEMTRPLGTASSVAPGPTVTPPTSRSRNSLLTR